MINLYEDISKTKKPTAEIIYNIKELTNLDVTATLVNPSTEIKITNNSGKDTYVFTKNDEFTFEFEDQYGNKGTATATVNWIDKTAPTASISYDIEEETNQSVTATVLDFSEKVTITNNAGKDTYVFKENGSFTFEFIDEAGNRGTATATVNWIKEESENPEEKPEEGEEQKPEEKPEEGEEQKPEEKPEEGEEQKPEEKPEEGEEQKPEEKPEEGEEQKPEEKPEEGEEQKPEEKPEQGEEQKPEEEPNQGNTSNANTLDNTIADGSLPQTGTEDTSILIMALGIIIVAIITYIRLKELQNKKNNI